MNIFADTCMESLTAKFLEDIFAKENFENTSSGKGSFLTGGSMIVCESKGLQEYIQKKCVDLHGIWTALSFKPLAGLLMRFAYNLSSDKKDENDNVFNQRNLIWAIYRLLEGEKKTFFFANELASLFQAYQIYRPQMIDNWNNNIQYTIPEADKYLMKNEKYQRELWVQLRKEYKNEKDISQLYELLINNKKNISYNKIFIFAPLSIAPVQLDALKTLSNSGCEINLYLYQISGAYTGDVKSDKSIAALRKKALESNFIADENNLYWDIGNRLVANLGRSSQILNEQIGWENLEYLGPASCEDTLLHAIQTNIINDNNEKSARKKDDSIVINNCFSPLREIEVLCDYLLGVFHENKDITPEDIAVVAPDIEVYANAIDSVFKRYDIPFVIADRDVKKHDKTARLLNMLFSIQGTDYESPDIAALFEYSLYAQDRQLDTNDTERLEKWLRENAIRHNIESNDEVPNYSIKSGLDQLFAGFFMLPENGFSGIGDYCYPDIEDSNLDLLAEFAVFTEALKRFENETKTQKTIDDWDYFFRENLQYFFGNDIVHFNEEEENPYQKVMRAWDSLKKEMLIGFGNSNFKIDFTILKTALPGKLEENSKYYYTVSGKVSFSNIETLRAVPHKVICCIGMNGKDFPRKAMYREMSLLNIYKPGDKDTVNEDRLIFLETIKSAKEKLYISWIGQNEKTADELDPSSAVIVFLNNLKEQYEIDEEDIVVKYPLQPFSKKYFEGELETYDNRWSANVKNKDSNVWNWRVSVKEDAKTDNTDELYRVLNDAPKHFIKNICNISLPEDTEILESIEPLIIDNALDKWKIGNIAINEADSKILENEMEIQKRKGELPCGIFAQNNIDSIKNDAMKLKEEAEKEKQKDGIHYWISPSSDKGKYRLKHWIKHLEHNLKNENQNTKMFLKSDKGSVKLELKGLSKDEADKYLKRLWKIKKVLNTRLIPVFTDAAWVFMTENSIENAEAKIFGKGDRDYSVIQTSKYGKMAFGDMETLEGRIKKDFIFYSKYLFKDCNFIEDKK